MKRFEGNALFAGAATRTDRDATVAVSAVTTVTITVIDPSIDLVPGWTRRSLVASLSHPCGRGDYHGERSKTVCVCVCVCVCAVCVLDFIEIEKLPSCHSPQFHMYVCTLSYTSRHKESTRVTHCLWRLRQASSSAPRQCGELSADSRHLQAASCEGRMLTRTHSISMNK